MNSEEIIESRVFNDTKIDLVSVDRFGHADYRDYRIDATSRDFSYQVSGLDKVDSLELMLQLPPATKEMHEAQFLAYKLDHETMNAKPGFYFFADKTGHPCFPENSVCSLKNLPRTPGYFITAVDEDDLCRPDFRAVAISDPHWNEEVTAVLGRIQTVYAYNAAEATHLAEITPSYALNFIKNVCEKPFADTEEEADIDKVFSSIGYDYEIDFESDDGGENLTYMHCRSINRMPSMPLPTDVATQFEYMFEDDESERLKIFKDHCAELEANGWFTDVANFENRRTDEEILAASKQFSCKL